LRGIRTCASKLLIRGSWPPQVCDFPHFGAKNPKKNQRIDSCIRASTILIL
jgi:hypothetical protein